MNGTLKVDPAELLKLSNDLSGTAASLTGDLPRLGAGQVGHGGVAAALDTFATNWNYHRRDVATWISGLATMLSAAGMAYLETEAGIKNAATAQPGSSPQNLGQSPQTPSPKPATDPYASTLGGQAGLSNARIADFAEAEATTNPGLYKGQTGWNQQGECMVAMARWVGAGGGAWGGSLGGPLSGYERSGAVTIPIDHLSRGDVIQRYVGDGSGWDGAHTAVVLSVDPANRNLVTVAESNYDLKGSMRIGTYDLSAPGLSKAGDQQHWNGYRLGGQP